MRKSILAHKPNKKIFFYRNTFIFTFLLGIYNLKPVTLFTNAMKKCMDIENGGSV